MNEHNSTGLSTAPLMDEPARDMHFSPVTVRRSPHPVLSPVFVRLLLFAVVALAFSGVVKQLVYAVHWFNSTSSSRAS